MAEPNRRKSLTKSQRESEIGAELIYLCQSVTDDGRLADSEISALRVWLDDNKGTDFPAIAFLSETVEKILSDGVVTEDERKELYKAIEAVLPPDIRESVKGTRVSIERGEKEEAKRKKAEEKEARQEEAERNSPIEKFDFMVAGVAHDGRQKVTEAFAEPGERAYLIRDRKNRHSRNAVEVRLSNGMMAGYVPEKFSGEIAAMLDKGAKHQAFIKKIIGYKYSIPVIVAMMYELDADVYGVVSEAEVPALVQPPRSMRGGCLTVILAAASAASCACLLMTRNF